MGWSEEAMIRAEDQHERWSERELRVDQEIADEERRYARQKAALEERMGLEGSHLSPQRLRLLDEYNRDAERMD